MQPYTSQGISKEDSKSLSESDKDLAEKDSDDQYFYELVGIIVHSGQANAGHYYSFIKNRRFVFLHIRRLYLILKKFFHEGWCSQLNSITSKN